MFEFIIGIAVMTFVSLFIAGSRAIKTLDRVNAEKAAKIANATRYTGPSYTAHGRAID